MALMHINYKRADNMETITLNKLKQSGEIYFKRKPDSKTVYIINHYNRDDKTFTCSDCNDINKEVFIKANKPIFIGFDY